jgi:CDP-glucose 4,6-dehydratase
LNIDKALFYLDWKPTLNFLETSSFTSAWYKEFYQQKTENMFDFTINQIRDYIEHAKNKNILWALR